MRHGEISTCILLSNYCLHRHIPSLLLLLPVYSLATTILPHTSALRCTQFILTSCSQSHSVLSPARRRQQLCYHWLWSFLISQPTNYLPVLSHHDWTGEAVKHCQHHYSATSAICERHCCSVFDDHQLSAPPLTLFEPVKLLCLLVTYTQQEAFVQRRITAPITLAESWSWNCRQCEHGSIVGDAFKCADRREGGSEADEDECVE